MPPKEKNVLPNSTEMSLKAICSFGTAVFRMRPKRLLGFAISLVEHSCDHVQSAGIISPSVN